MISETIYDNSKFTIASDITVTPVDISMPDIRLLSEPIMLDDTIGSTRTRYQHPFYYYKNDTIIGRSLAYYGEYTELELECLKHFVKNSDCVIYDIGANIGYHTTAFARWCKYVEAFEPNSKNLELLKKNLVNMPHVTVYPYAVSDKKGVTTIQDFDTTVPGNYGEMYLNVPGQSCETVCIDDMDELYPPDIVKIDVEGHELSVLRGMVKTLHEYKPVIFYEAHGTELDEIYDMLSAMDYKLYWFPCANYNPNNYNNSSYNIFGNGGVLNIIAVHGMKIGNLLPVLRNQSFKMAYEQYLQNNKE